MSDPRDDHVNVFTVLASVVFTVRKGDAEERHEFKRGLGPCGKTVTKLSSFFDDRGLLVIIQYCDDQTKQIFEYHPRLLLSRVRRDYEPR